MPSDPESSDSDASTTPSTDSSKRSRSSSKSSAPDSDSDSGSKKERKSSREEGRGKEGRKKAPYDEKGRSTEQTEADAAKAKAREKARAKRRKQLEREQRSSEPDSSGDETTKSDRSKESSKRESSRPRSDSSRQPSSDGGTRTEEEEAARRKRRAARKAAEEAAQTTADPSHGMSSIAPVTSELFGKNGRKALKEWQKWLSPTGKTINQMHSTMSDWTEEEQKQGERLLKHYLKGPGFYKDGVTTVADTAPTMTNDTQYAPTVDATTNTAPTIQPQATTSPPTVAATDTVAPQTTVAAPTSTAPQSTTYTYYYPNSGTVASTVPWQYPHGIPPAPTSMYPLLPPGTPIPTGPPMTVTTRDPSAPVTGMSLGMLGGVALSALCPPLAPAMMLGGAATGLAVGTLASEKSVTYSPSSYYYPPPQSQPAPTYTPITVTTTV